MWGLVRCEYIPVQTKIILNTLNILIWLLQNMFPARHGVAVLELFVLPVIGTIEFIL